MDTITANDTLSLSIPERIQLVKDIWDTIEAEADSVELSEKEKKILNVRLETYHRNPESGSPWEEVYQRITKGNEI